MTDQFHISYAVLDGLAWIRCEGRGSFSVSPKVKCCAESILAKGITKIVVDLEKCLGMDSTFMGMLAGLGGKIMKLGQMLQIVHAGEKNRASLEDLGMDALMEIDVQDFSSVEKSIGASLTTYAADDTKLPCKAHVLESHEILAQINDENAEKFRHVLDHMKKPKDAS